MLDALEVGNPHEVSVGVSDDEDVSMDVQTPLAIQAVVGGQLIGRTTPVHRVVVPKGAWWVHWERGQPLALVPEREPLSEVQVVGPHRNGVVIKLVYHRKENGTRTTAGNRVQNGTYATMKSFL